MLDQRGRTDLLRCFKLFMNHKGLKKKAVP